MTHFGTKMWVETEDVDCSRWSIELLGKLYKADRACARKPWIGGPKVPTPYAVGHFSLSTFSLPLHLSLLELHLFIILLLLPTFSVWSFFQDTRNQIPPEMPTEPSACHCQFRVPMFSCFLVYLVIGSHMNKTGIHFKSLTNLDITDWRYIISPIEKGTNIYNSTTTYPS